MAAVPTVGRWAVRVFTAVVLLALACTEPQSTEPDIAGPAFAKVGGGDPTVTSANPSEAPQDSTLDVHVLGTNYDQGSKVDFARAGVVDPKLHVNSTAYLSSTELVANVSVAADAAPVFYDVMVTKSTGKKGIGTEKFAVLVPVELLSAPSGFSDVQGVSDNGLVAGRTSTSCGPSWAPAVWDQFGQLTALPALPGTCGGIAHDVNSAGVAVGAVYIGSSTSSDVQWVPSGGSYQIQQLPRLPDGSLAGVWDINEAGSMVGANTASFWSASTGWQILPRPAGATSCLGEISLNDANAIVGSCTIAGQQKAVYWASPTASPVLLPVAVGGSRASAWDINNAGVIVGYTAIGTRKTVNRATRWMPSGGGSWTVEFLSDLGTGSTAEAINQAGQIVGSVDAHGNRPAFWDANGMLRQLEGTGEARSLSELAAGPVVAGYVANAGSKVAALWRP
ncbi:MAG TPA: hypothetical protein VIG08_02200 [Gemmatimonadales bacterium]|jgi:uncharacterized membrane protein